MLSWVQVVDTAKGVVDRDITREEKFAGDRDAKSAEKITINAPKTPVRMKGKQM